MFLEITNLHVRLSKSNVIKALIVQNKMWLLCGAWGDDIMSEHNQVGKLFPTMRARRTITGLSPEDLLFIPVKPSSEKETGVYSHRHPYTKTPY